MDKVDLNIKIKLLSPGARAPHKSHKGDAGWDLFSAVEADIPPGSAVVVKTGIALEIPHGWYGQIKSRSGLGAKGLIVTAGVIDSGYRGEVGVVLINGNRAEGPGLKDNGHFRFSPGDKIAQLVILPVPEVTFEVAEELNDTVRGENGFGSTGGR